MLLDEWVPDPARPGPEEALAIIALRYFRSHGPTTDKDFAGWTGLPITQCRRGIAAVGDALAKIDVDGVAMYADAALIQSYAPSRRRVAHPLPGFDEYLLGYKDRAMMVDAAHQPAIIPGNNGVFQATIVLGGRVVGTWRRATKRSRAEVTISALTDISVADRAAIESAFQPYGRFLGTECQIAWS
jgi:hypothetical protein